MSTKRTTTSSSASTTSSTSSITTEPASTLVEDLGILPRQTIDDVLIRAFSEAILAGETLPPIIADRKTRIVVDGIHRRRAAIRAHGPAAMVMVMWRDYPDRGSMLLDAARINTRHGKRLSISDMMRVVVLADEMQISRTLVADALGVRAHVLDTMYRRIVAYDAGHRPMPTKPAMRHMAGELLTPEQVMANKHLGGHQARYLVRQLIVLLEANAINWNDTVLVDRLRQVWQLLDVHFGVEQDLGQDHGLSA